MGDGRLDTLGRYAVALVLSFLTECEGTSFLLTKKRYARTILPLFRLPSHGGLRVVNAKYRHHFVEYSAQDPEVLLERLNTRRLRKRVIGQGNLGEYCYELNKTARELALSEQVTAKLSPEVELLRFLTPKDTTIGISLLVSYPRSGNTLLRNLLERLSGIVTGSDNRPDRKLSRDLAVKHNLVGEGVGKRIHVLKTHYPERTGFRATAQRSILLVRNPYDAIDSYWNLNLTNTHTETVTDEVYAKYQDTFQDLAKNELQVWLKFHRFWLESSIPVLLVRFEDLVSNMEQELTRIAKFLHMDVSRVRHACSSDSGTSQLGSYRPRSTGKKPFGKSIEKGRYTNEMLQEFQSIDKQHSGWNDKSMLEFFGYTIPEFPDNFLTNTAPAMPNAPSVRGKAVMDINTGYQLRPPSDKYGRHMKQWRQARTNQDRDPFPIVSR